MFPHGLGQAAGSQMKRTFKGQLKDSTEHVDKGHLETLTTQHFRKGLPCEGFFRTERPGF